MSKRYMTDGEVVTFFRQAADPKAEIRILAELNNCCTDEIIAILHSRGIKTPRVRRYDPGGEGSRAKTSPGKFKIGRWSAQDTQTVIDMCRDGYGTDPIADAVGRSKAAVKNRIQKLRKEGVQVEYRKKGRNSAD